MDATEFRDFMLAGRAVFTVTSRRTGARFTYRVARADKGAERYYVHVLTGPDNDRDYAYAGMLFPSGTGLRARQTHGSRVLPTAPSWMGFVWLVSMLNAGRDYSNSAAVDHAGRCARCGRTLTVPESIRTGLGPECAKKIAAGS